MQNAEFKIKIAIFDMLLIREVLLFILNFAFVIFRLMSAIRTTWTLGRLLTWTTDYLKQHGSDSPRLDAEVLLATAAELSADRAVHGVR